MKNCFLLIWFLVGFVGHGAGRMALNEWMLEVPGGLEVARQLADDYGFKLVKEVTNTFYRFLSPLLFCASKISR